MGRAQPQKGRRELGKKSQPSAPLLSPAAPARHRQSSGTVAMPVRDCPSHHLPGRTRNSLLLGASSEQHKPNSIRSTSEHLGPPMPSTLCHKEHPSTATQPKPQCRVITPSPGSGRDGPCSVSLAKCPIWGWDPEQA